MKKNYLKISLLALSMIAAVNASAAPVKDKGKKSFNQTDAIALVKDMGSGWNLGNTFDANGCKGLASENSWGQPTTTKEMIDALAASGFKTIRIPTSWANHIIDDKFTIDPKWMARVKEVVDWAIADGMYVILNTHHDNYERASGMPHCGGYYPDPVNYNESMLFIKNVWTQISTAFNNGYDEHLIFEIMNEPRLRGNPHEWYTAGGCNECKYAAQTVNKLNQVGLNAIRETGGNNMKRFVMVCGIAASPDCEMGEKTYFKFPKDNEEKVTNQRLLLSTHLYKPYSFAMENPGETKFTEKHKKEIDFYMEAFEQNFISKGIPVVIGEYGAVNKKNPEDRYAWFDAFNAAAKEKGICCVLWDNGDWHSTFSFEEKFGFYNRTEGTWYFPELLPAILQTK